MAASQLPQRPDVVQRQLLFQLTDFWVLIHHYVFALWIIYYLLIGSCNPYSFLFSFKCWATF